MEIGLDLIKKILPKIKVTIRKFYKYVCLLLKNIGPMLVNLNLLKVLSNSM